MEKKKICFIVASPNTARSFLKEPFKLLSKNYDIYLVANIKETDDLSDMCITGYKSIPIESKPNIKVDFKALSLLIKYFKEMKFDSVHSLTKKASLLTTIAGRLARIKFRLHHFTGQMWATMSGIKRMFYKYMDLFIVLSDTHMLVDGHSQREFLEKEHILKKGQGTVLSNGSICGVNTLRFRKDLTAREKVRSELNINDNSIIFIFLGRLKKDKGIYELLAAFNTIVQTSPDAILLLVGADEEKCIDKLSNYPNLILNKNVISYGFTNAPEDLLNAADVYVLPTYREGFGLSILEASSTGLPVIVSDTYGVRDSIIDNETGLRCKTYDIDSLVKCMKYLYDNPTERKRLGDNGIKYVNEKFTTEIVCKAWFDYYKNVVK